MADRYEFKNDVTGEAVEFDWSGPKPPTRRDIERISSQQRDQRIAAKGRVLQQEEADYQAKSLGRKILDWRPMPGIQKAVAGDVQSVGEGFEGIGRIFAGNETWNPIEAAKKLKEGYLESQAMAFDPHTGTPIQTRPDEARAKSSTSHLGGILKMGEAVGPPATAVGIATGIGAGGLAARGIGGAAARIGAGALPIATGFTGGVTVTEKTRQALENTDLDPNTKEAISQAAGLIAGGVVGAGVHALTPMPAAPTLPSTALQVQPKVFGPRQAPAWTGVTEFPPREISPPGAPIPPPGSPGGIGGPPVTPPRAPGEPITTPPPRPNFAQTQPRLNRGPLITEPPAPTPTELIVRPEAPIQAPPVIEPPPVTEQPLGGMGAAPTAETGLTTLPADVATQQPPISAWQRLGRMLAGPRPDFIQTGLGGVRPELRILPGESPTAIPEPFQPSASGYPALAQPSLPWGGPEPAGIGRPSLEAAPVPQPTYPAPGIGGTGIREIAPPPPAQLSAPAPGQPALGAPPPPYTPTPRPPSPPAGPFEMPAAPQARLPEAMPPVAPPYPVAPPIPAMPARGPRGLPEPIPPQPRSPVLQPEVLPPVTPPEIPPESAAPTIEMAPVEPPAPVQAPPIAPAPVQQQAPPAEAPVKRGRGRPPGALNKKTIEAQKAPGPVAPPTKGGLAGRLLGKKPAEPVVEAAPVEAPPPETQPLPPEVVNRLQADETAIREIKGEEPPKPEPPKPVEVKPEPGPVEPPKSGLAGRLLGQKKLPGVPVEGKAPQAISATTGEPVEPKPTATPKKELTNISTGSRDPKLNNAVHKMYEAMPDITPEQIGKAIYRAQQDRKIFSPGMYSQEAFIEHARDIINSRRFVEGREPINPRPAAKYEPEMPKKAGPVKPPIGGAVATPGPVEPPVTAKTPVEAKPAVQAKPPEAPKPVEAKPTEKAPEKAPTFQNLAHDPETGKMTVEIKGKKYEYKDVTPEEFKEFQDEPSKGKAIRKFYGRELDTEITSPESKIAAKKNEVLSYLKKRVNSTVAQLQREFGLPRDAVENILSDFQKRNLIEGKAGKYNYKAVRGEEIPKGEPETVAKSEAPKVEYTSERTAKIEALNKELEKAVQENDPDLVDTIQQQIKNQESYGKAETQGTAEQKQAVKDIQELNERVSELEDKESSGESLTPEETREQIGIYAKLAKAEKAIKDFFKSETGTEHFTGFMNPETAAKAQAKVRKGLDNLGDRIASVYKNWGESGETTLRKEGLGDLVDDILRTRTGSRQAAGNLTADFTKNIEGLSKPELKEFMEGLQDFKKSNNPKVQKAVDNETKRYLKVARALDMLGIKELASDPTFSKRTDPGILQDYYTEATKRIGELRELGKRKVSSPGKTLPEDVLFELEELKKRGGNYARAKDAAEAIFDPNKLSENQQKIWNFISQGQMLTKLPLSFIGNLTQPANIAMVTGNRSLGRAFLKELKDFKGSKEEALRSGSILSDVTNQALEEAGVSPKTWAGKMLTAHSKIEIHNRVLATLAGQEHAATMFKKLKADPTSKYARRQLSHWLGLDPDVLLKKGELSVSDYRTAGQTLSEKTQFGSTAMELPPGWKDSLTSRMITQFKGFGFNQAKFMKQALLSEVVKHRNPRPLLPFVTTMPALGLAATATRKMITGREQADNALELLVDAYSGAGGIGTVADIASQAYYNKLGQWAAGPTFSDIGELGMALHEDASRYESDNPLTQEKTGRSMAKLALKNTPVAGKIVAGRVFPPLSAGRSAGRVTRPKRVRRSR